MRSIQNGWLRLVLVTLSLILASFFHLPVSGAANLTLIRTPSSGYQPRFQIFRDKIYYVWHEYDGPSRQIFTAQMNLDGTGWMAEKRTSGQYDKTFPQLQVVKSRIYYVCQQPDAKKYRQMWTMEMNIDGTGWKEVQRTNSLFDKQFPELQVVGNDIYYTWNESDGKYRQIWTAEMKVDGSGWDAVKRTSTPFDKYEPQLQVLGERIYFVWREFDGSHFQIWTGVVDRNGTGWQAIKRTGSPYDKHNPQLSVKEKRIYFTWHEADGSDSRKATNQIWTAHMDIDGSGWQAIQRTFTPFGKYTPQLWVEDERIYYVWEESDGKYRQIWTAAVNKDESGWKAEKRTKSPFGKYDPHFEVFKHKIYYVWHENHGRIEPIWVAND